MSLKINVNLQAFKEQLRATAEELNRATRPAAQAGAQIIYDRARQYVPISSRAHMFYGRNAVYGPYSPGNLRDAIYQVFSEDKSHKDVSTYHVSWNASKAPYAWMVELGTSKAPAHSFLGRAIKDTRTQVREAIKKRFLEEIGQ